jgi:hypothetical protein
MEMLNSVIEYCKAHWVDVLAIIGAVDIALGVIVKLTPCKWDNNVYTLLHNWIAKLLVKK